MSKIEEVLFEDSGDLSKSQMDIADKLNELIGAHNELEETVEELGTLLSRDEHSMVKLEERVEKLERDLMFATRGEIVLTEDVPYPTDKVDNEVDNKKTQVDNSTDEWPSEVKHILADLVYESGVEAYERNIDKAEAKLKALLEGRK